MENMMKVEVNISKEIYASNPELALRMAVKSLLRMMGHNAIVVEVDAAQPDAVKVSVLIAAV